MQGGLQKKPIDTKLYEVLTRVWPGAAESACRSACCVSARYKGGLAEYSGKGCQSKEVLFSLLWLSHWGYWTMCQNGPIKVAFLIYRTKCITHRTHWSRSRQGMRGRRRHLLILQRHHSQQNLACRSKNKGLKINWCYGKPSIDWIHSS